MASIGIERKGRQETLEAFGWHHSISKPVQTSPKPRSGVEPRGFRPVVRGSYEQLRKEAIDPSTFGLHSEREYAKHPKLTPYSDDVVMRWVWAYSFRRQAPTLVPLQIGFYSWARKEDREFVVGEGSSGCATGTCVEEAVLHGIFEVAERDAYMMTWLARLALPQMDPWESTDPEVRHTLARLRSEGFEVLAFDATTDLSIPALCLLARRGSKWPHLLAAAAAHLQPERALKKALRELVGGLSLWEFSHPVAQTRAQEFADDPSLVQKPMDHGLMYTAAAAMPFCDFLTHSTARTSLRAMEAPVRSLWSEDMGRDVQGLVEHVISRGLDVIATRHTAPEQEAHGLEVMKVSIPGAVPGTWGDNLRRTEGLPRLHSMLQRMGGLAPNPLPHPFP